ncbi:MAG: hypothetical protein F6K28_60215 [Microcoleus sp. SIO2G3]|nr:hypothetical protein [Microcoleus sp. SIO2G3]
MVSTTGTVTASAPTEVEFGQAPPLTPLNVPAGEPDRSSGRSYYVVIPGQSEDISAISNQVMRLGEGLGIAQQVTQGSSPRGAHVQVGPFADRGTASRWNRYFRDFGMDARIYTN